MANEKTGDKKPEASSTSKNDDNIMGAIAYLLSVLTGVVVYIMYKDKGNKFVIFHALQSIICGIAVLCAMMVLFFVQIVLVAIPVIGWIISLLLIPLWLGLGLVMLGLWVMLMYKAYSGVKYKLPVIGDMAEKYV